MLRRIVSAVCSKFSKLVKRFCLPPSGPFLSRFFRGVFSGRGTQNAHSRSVSSGLQAIQLSQINDKNFSR